jgi:hypothetical protein
MDCACEGVNRLSAQWFCKIFSGAIFAKQAYLICIGKCSASQLFTLMLPPLRRSVHRCVLLWGSSPMIYKKGKRNVLFVFLRSQKYCPVPSKEKDFTFAFLGRLRSQVCLKKSSPSLLPGYASSR